MDINIQQKDIALIFLQLSQHYSESIDTQTATKALNCNRD